MFFRVGEREGEVSEILSQMPFADEDSELHRGEVNRLTGGGRAGSGALVSRSPRHFADTPLTFCGGRLSRTPTPFFIQKKVSYPVPTPGP